MPVHFFLLNLMFMTRCGNACLNMGALHHLHIG